MSWELLFVGSGFHDPAHGARYKNHEHTYYHQWPHVEARDDQTFHKIFTIVCHIEDVRGFDHRQEVVPVWKAELRQDMISLCILPQSSGEFDPEGNPELKKPLDPSETLIQRNFRKL